MEYDDLPEGYGSVCPDPLHVVRHDIDADAEHVHGTACVLPCPGVSSLVYSCMCGVLSALTRRGCWHAAQRLQPAFSSTEWDILTNVAQWFAVASLTLSAVVIASYSEEKNRYVRYLCYGNVLFLQSLPGAVHAQVL